MAQSFCINSFCLQNISKNTVVIVAGPTASGKSDWATFYAQQETQDTTGLNTRDPAPKDLGIKDRPIKDLHSSALAPEPPPGLREHAEQTALVAPQSGLATREKSCVQKTGGGKTS